jgi:hypothetical protein
MQDSEIQKSMRSHCKGDSEAFENENIDLFVQLFRDVVTAIEPDAIEVAGFCSEDDNVTFGFLPADVIESLMANVHRNSNPENWMTYDGYRFSP